MARTSSAETAQTEQSDCVTMRFAVAVAGPVRVTVFDAVLFVVLKSSCVAPTVTDVVDGTLQADHQAVDRPSRRTAGLSSQSKEPDQRDHRHRGRHCVEQPRSRRLRPQHVRPERDYRHDRNEQRAAEGRDHPLLQPGKDRPGVACHRQEREQAGEDQQYAYDLADLALREMRTARSFGARGSRSRGRGATGASRV